MQNPRKLLFFHKVSQIFSIAGDVPTQLWLFLLLAFPIGAQHLIGSHLSQDLIQFSAALGIDQVVWRQRKRGGEAAKALARWVWVQQVKRNKWNLVDCINQ